MNERKIMSETSFVPKIDNCYLKFGNYHRIEKIIESKRFYPIWITGLSGNGKTQMVEQACANTGREFIRVNFTIETDENDLIGGWRIQNGETVFHEGPIVQALRKGAVLLLDEVDAGHTNRLLTLQPILEGKGVLIKATGEWVEPSEGFQVFATSNTKGRGSEDGKFIGTNIMNGAFLDRFCGMIEQDYPNIEHEEMILKRAFVEFHWKGKRDLSTLTAKDMAPATEFITKLCKWSSNIRNAYTDGAVDEVITTRSLVNIIKGYSIMDNPKEAIAMACSRYDSNTRDAFLEYYSLINGDEEQYQPSQESDDNNLDDIQF